MARDMKKKYASDKVSQDKIYDRFSVKVRIESHLMELMKEAAGSHGTTKNSYVKDAVKEKLIRDGYLKPDDPSAGGCEEPLG